jgi:predicted acylesterase/phospholipase RssA
MSERFQVLSLDGGGYRGMFGAAVLARLEDDLGVSVSDHFDLVAGASTGGVIALGLGAGLTPLNMVRFYAEHGPDIFRGRRRRTLRQLVRAKYPSGPFRQALEEVFGDRLFGSSRLRLVIPAYDVRNDKTCLFRTDHCEHLNRDWKEKMVDVALAATAAPTFLPAHQLTGRRLIDGGVWANNPVVVALVEAVTFLGIELSDLRILSLGTTFEVKERPPKLDHGGLWQWKGDATDVFLRGQSLGASSTAMNLVGEKRFMRIDPAMPADLLDLDRISTDELLGRAHDESKHRAPEFKEKFMGHVATPHVSPNI